MISREYPQLYYYNTSYSLHSGWKLHWQDADLFISLKDFNDETDTLEQNLIDHMDHYNIKLAKNEDRLLTLEYIKEIVDKFKKYDEFRTELSAIEVAQNLKYTFDSDCYITNELHDLFSEKYNIPLYESKYFDFIQKNYAIKYCNLEGQIFYTINDKPAFLLNRNNNIFILDGNVYDAFVNDMFKILRSTVENNNLDDYRFPTYIEDVIFYPLDEKYVFINGEFIEYDENTHSIDLPKFKKLKGE